MTDQELDRALERALGAEPRADFLARVRMRVAAGPAPSPRTAWLPAAAVAAVAIITAVSYWPGVENEPAGGRTSAAAESSGASSAGRIEERRTESPAPVAVASPARLVSRPKDAVDSPPTPLISREDANSVRLLVASAQQGIAAELLSSSDGHDQTLELAALDVPLLGTERPIEMNAVDAGERQ